MNWPKAGQPGYAIWTEEESQTAQRLRDKGKTPAQIARVLKRSECAIKGHLIRVRNKGREKSVTKNRRCLCCQNEFVSAGPQNRLCNDCRRQSVSPYAP